MVMAGWEIDFLKRQWDGRAGRRWRRTRGLGDGGWRKRGLYDFGRRRQKRQLGAADHFMVLQNAQGSVVRRRTWCNYAVSVFGVGCAAAAVVVLVVVVVVDS